MTTRNSNLLTPGAGNKWLLEHEYIVPYEDQFDYSVNLRIPQDSGRKFALIKQILGWLPNDGMLLLLVTGWRVWPSSENEELFHRMHESIGMKRMPIIDAPGQLLDLSDRPFLECMLDICLLNLWDWLVADEKRRFLILSSHDEILSIACNNDLKNVCATNIECFLVE